MQSVCRGKGIIDEEVLQKARAVMLDLMLQVDRVCRELGLRYSLSSGTLLGAVRHSGFIPWDDDVDLIMPRDDYEVFLEKAPSLLDGDKYYLDHFSTNRLAKGFYAKLRNSQTTYIERELKSANQGIFVDIFPIDRFVDSPSRIMRRVAMSWLFFFLTYRTYISTLRGMPLWKQIVGCCLLPLRKLIGHNRLLRWEDRMHQRCNGRPEAQFTFADFLYNRRVMPREWFQEYTTLPFEGHDFSVISHFKEYLEACYGDYMTPPPVEERIAALHALIIDPERPYGEYLDVKGRIIQGAK